MPGLFAYILKLSISLAVVYLFYHFVLRKLTFYGCNRWYLLGYSLLSFFIAFLNIAPLFQTTLQSYNKAIQLVPPIDFSDNISVGKDVAAAGQGDWNNWSWCLCIVIGGAIILSIRLIVQYLSFLNIRRKAQLLSENETRVYHVEADIIPFSFGSSIFINKQLHSLNELQEIVRHEFVHVKQKHSIDILWSELLCIVNWYNPFAWLLKRSIRQNLEFIADSQVLESGMNKKEYQYLLLKVIGNNHFSIASKFNFSSLKKRIAMMNKMKTARVQLVKFLFILPLVAVLLIAFRKKEHEANPGAQRRSVTQEITFPSLHLAYDSDTTPKAKSDRKQMDDEGIDNFEITDKKAVIHFGNGKTEKYDITDSSQRRIFEKKYGKIISAFPGTDEAAPVTIVTASVEASGVSEPSVTTAPVIVNASGETVVAANPVITTTTSAAPVIVSTSSTKSVAAIDDLSPAIANEDVLVTITKNTTAGQLEDFKKQMKEKGYELNFDKTTYSDAGRLTQISGTIKSGNNESKFSASDFERVVVTRLWQDNDAYFKVNIIVKKKPKVVI